MEKLLGTAEASAVIGYEVATMARWRKQKKGPAWFKYGKHVKYPESAIEAWIKEQMEQAAGQRKSA